MEGAMGADAPLIAPVIKSVYEVIGSAGAGDLRFEGVNKMLQCPEFSDIDRIREMFDVLENKDGIMSVMTKAESDRVNVLIGGETTVREMANSTLVFRNLTGNGRVVGAIGVIGPCRMDYSKVVTLLEAMSDRMTGMLDGGPPGLASGHPDGKETT